MVSKFRKFQGGVESHLFDLSRELRERGVEVQSFTSEDVEDSGGSVFSAHPNSVGEKFQAARNLLWNPNARSQFQLAIRDFAPDIIHYHSIYHQLSPSLLGVFNGPQIMTLHDYKIAAPCYTLYRHGEVCTDCVGTKFSLPSIRHKCISGNTAASVLCSVESVLHGRRYKAEIGAFIVPSQYSLGIMKRAGIPEESIKVIPWGVQQRLNLSASEVAKPKAPYVVTYVGRLHMTKGVQLVLSAWRARDRSLDLRLVIAGAGEMEEDVLKLVAEDSAVEFRGLVSQTEVTELLKRSDLSLVPSLFPETMGLSALESLTLRTPIVSSGRGALGDLRGAGVIELRAASPSELASIFSNLFGGEKKIDELTRDLAARDLSIYSPRRMVDAIQGEYRTLTDNGGPNRPWVS